MELTSAHLRYLLAIYEVSQTHLDISSRSIAEKLGVTKPSVVRIMNLLMERGMIRKGALRQDLYDRPGHLGGKTGGSGAENDPDPFPTGQ